MRTALLTLALLASACASHVSGDLDTLQAGKPYGAAVPAPACVIPVAGTWRVDAKAMGAGCIFLSVDLWRFGDDPQISTLRKIDPSTCTHHHQDTDSGCHRSDEYACPEAKVSLQVDYESDTTLTGKMTVAFDGAVNMDCAATYSVALVLIKE